MTPFLSFSTFSLSADGPLNPASSVSGEGQELLGQDAEAVEFAELFQLQTRTLEPGLASLSAGRAEVEGDAEESLTELLAGGQSLPEEGSGLPPTPAESGLPSMPTAFLEGAEEDVEGPPVMGAGLDSFRLVASSMVDLGREAPPGGESELAPSRLVLQQVALTGGEAGEPANPGLISAAGLVAQGEGRAVRPDGLRGLAVLGPHPAGEWSPAEAGEGERSPFSESLLTASMSVTRTAPPTGLPQGLAPAAALVPTAALPLDQAGWDRVLGQRLSWMIESGNHSVDIALDPPELGPLQVRISTQNDQAQVHFVSSQAAVRDALEQALPRLRDMLEAQGLQLAHADVSDQSPQSHTEPGSRAETSPGEGGGPETAETLEGQSPLRGPSRGLVDDYV